MTTNLLVFLLIFPVFSSQADHFWLTAEMESINWREGCLTTALCSQPRFQLIKDLLPLSERISVNWPISEHFGKDSNRPFISYWPTGRVEDISLSAQVVGTDRTYGFPRICDQTPSIRVFPEEKPDKKSPKASIGEPTAPTNSIHLQIKGKCFNATLTVTKHQERCPWCADPREVTIIGQEASSGVGGGSTLPSATWLFAPLAGDERMVHVGVMVLAVVAVLASSAFAILLVVYLRNKRLSKEQQSRKMPRFHPYISVKGHEIEDPTSRYDMPWEQHNRPLTYWMTSSNKSDTTTITSPLDSASSLGGGGTNGGCTNTNKEMYYTTRDGYQTYRPPPPPPHPPIFPPQTQLFYPHTATNNNQPSRTIIMSPVGSRNDDSGLESV